MSKKRTRRLFSKEFKQDPVNLVTHQGYSLKTTAEAVGVETRLLRDWHEKLAPIPEPCGDDASVKDLKAENKRLRKQLKDAEMEREISKKATAYFAKESL
ncbi:transposase [Rhodopirellula europaea]|mgnify:CR=1 FL=1|uniref:transposase n=1 Tax=Rhodopirellula europaea TaxID=1263866 RepID=UPI003D264CE6|tara:strand:- start:6097 stop:6396 length:300 start_codon:yes stop_codon:yes gene_type:complete